MRTTIFMALLAAIFLSGCRNVEPRHPRRPHPERKKPKEVQELPSWHPEHDINKHPSQWKFFPVAQDF
jgi:hypothetical protein